MATGPIITIGSFDGVHRGHAALLTYTVAAAHKRRVRSMALTFDVPPKIILNRDPSKIMLSTPFEKEYLIRRFGVHDVLFLRFDQKIMTLKPFLFVRDFLIKELKAKGIVVGEDFRFGADRSAGGAELVRWGGEFEIPVWVIPAVRSARHPISSSRIRNHFHQNKYKAATGLLGHSYFISGSVVRGNGKGREIGFPTANLRVDEEKLLPTGVFAVKGWIVSSNDLARRTMKSLRRSNQFKGVCNIGRRPTVLKTSPLIAEIHLFKCSRRLNGKALVVELVRHLRGEKKFHSIDELKKAIAVDIKRAEKILS